MCENESTFNKFQVRGSNERARVLCVAGLVFEEFN